MGLKFSNFGKAIISSAPDGATGLSFTVEAGKGALFPVLASGDYFYGVFKNAAGNKEVIKVSARSADTFTISDRGIDGTTARTWVTGDYFVAALTNIALGESLSNEILRALSGLPASADKLPYFTSSADAALTDLTPFARNLLDDADAAAMRTTLGAKAATTVSIPSGSRMVFYMPAAPSGWTKDPNTSLNHAMRIVGGAGGGFGGAVPFTSAFTTKGISGTVGATTLTIAQMPAHQHTVSGSGTNVGGGAGYTYWASSESFVRSLNSSWAGGGGAHSHGFSGSSIDLRVNYLDFILATKN